MEALAELFERFYNLPGSLISEKKKNFNEFVNILNSNLPYDVGKEAFIRSLIPHNELEESFKIDLMIHFQMYKNLLEILKGGNVRYISKILNDWNFFKESFKNVTGQTLVNDILPHTSFNTRQKVINRISKTLDNEKRAEEYYEAIEEKYGILSANILLAYCSIEFIKLKIEKYHFDLEYRQLVTIIKSNPHFFDYYLTNHRKPRNIGKLLKIILKHDEELVYVLCKKHNISLYFGKHYTKKFLNQNDDLLESNNENRKHFNKRQIYQRLRKNPAKFKRFIIDLMPEEISDSNPDYSFHYTEINAYIRFVSKNRRYTFLNSFIKDKYGFYIEDKLENITEQMFLLMPVEIREKILKETVETSDALIYLYQPKLSVPYLLNKIKHSSDMYNRIEYVNLMYKTCTFHNDEKYLLETLKYVEKRHRNDKEALRNFFNLLSSWRNIDLLSREHWTYIDTIEKLLEIQEISDYKKFYLEKRISNLIENNLDIDEQMKNYLAYVRNFEHFIFFGYLEKHRKSCLLAFEKYINSTQYGSSRKLYINYLCSIFEYNTLTHTKEDEISILNYLSSLKNFLAQDFHSVQHIISHYLPRYYEELNPIIWEYRRKFFENTSILRWYIKNREHVLLENINLILEIPEARQQECFIRLILKYTFGIILQTVVDFSLRLFNEDNLDNKIYAIHILSLLNQQEFVKIIPAYYPPADGKINIEEPPEKVKIQEALLINLKYLSNPTEAWPHILIFSKGDYLKYSLQPLYNISTNTPEKDLEPFLKRIHNAAVSVRKHAIHLSKILFTIDNFCAFIKEQSRKEKDASLKTILFQKALECAAVMPIAKFWDLLKATMHGIDKEDTTANDLLLEINKIPSEYRAEYVPEAYSLLNTNPLNAIRHKRFTFMERIPSHVFDELNYDILEIFISETLFTSNDQIPYYWTSCVFYTTGIKQNALFNFALQKFEEFHRTRILSQNIHPKEISFKNNFCKSVFSFHPNIEFVERFTTMWFSKFSPDLDVESYIYLQLLIAFAECTYNVQHFAIKSHNIFKKFLNDFGTYLFEIFAYKIIEFMKKVDVELPYFVQLLLDINEDIPTCLLAIKLLAVAGKPRGEALRYYRNTCCKLRERPELCIKTYFRCKLSDYTTR